MTDTMPLPVLLLGDALQSLLSFPADMLNLCIIYLRLSIRHDREVFCASAVLAGFAFLLVANPSATLAVALSPVRAYRWLSAFLCRWWRVAAERRHKMVALRSVRAYRDITCATQYPHSHDDAEGVRERQNN